MINKDKKEISRLKRDISKTLSKVNALISIDTADVPTIRTAYSLIDRVSYMMYELDYISSKKLWRTKND